MRDKMIYFLSTVCRSYHGLVGSTLHEDDHIIILDDLVYEFLDRTIGGGAEESYRGKAALNI